MLTAHAGNWQVMMKKLPAFGVDINILIRRENNKAVGDFLRIDEPEHAAIRIINPDEGPEAALAIMRELSSGNIVSIMGDAPNPGSKTIKVEFFGGLMELPEGPFRIAASCGAPILFLLASRRAPCEYALEVNEIVVKESEQLSETKVRMTRLARAYAATLERFLMNNPFEWTPGGKL